VVRYEPANSLETPRFSGVRTFMRLLNVQATGPNGRHTCDIERLLRQDRWVIKGEPTGAR
jgi:hypothetical protein